MNAPKFKAIANQTLQNAAYLYGDKVVEKFQDNLQEFVNLLAKDESIEVIETHPIYAIIKRKGYFLIHCNAQPTATAIPLGKDLETGLEKHVENMETKSDYILLHKFQEILPSVIIKYDEEFYS